MLQGFYGIPAERFQEVKDGEVLSLGDVNLRFYFTPMVHWPETMMTYLEEEGVLFSGDAFGCFGALNGGIVDTEMDTRWYIPEMYRYYSNIVGKYGKPVQKALEKTSGLDIQYLASTHGPVWKQWIPEVVDLYRRMSLYEGEDGVTIVYGSMYGNTGTLAEVIAGRLAERGVKTIKVHNVSKSEMSYIISDAFRYKGLIVGSPTYSMHLFPQINEFMTAMEVREVKNKVLATFGSYTWASAACKKMNECAERMKIDMLHYMEMKQGADIADIEAAVELADKVADEMGYPK